MSNRKTLKSKTLKVYYYWIVVIKYYHIRVLSQLLWEIVTLTAMAKKDSG